MPAKRFDAENERKNGKKNQSGGKVFIGYGDERQCDEKLCYNVFYNKEKLLRIFGGRNGLEVIVVWVYGTGFGEVYQAEFV